MSRHIFDENCRQDQVTAVRAKIASVSQAGADWSPKGWKDEEQILRNLHNSRATFHTHDQGFFDRKLCHRGYCLVCYEVPPAGLAEWVLRFLSHERFSTHAKRMGKVIRVHPAKIEFFQLHDPRMRETEW